MSFKGLRKAAMAVALLAAVSGCALLPDNGSKPVIPLTTPAAEQEIKLPLESYYPTPEQDALLNRARGQLILECMSGFGLTFNPGAPSESGTDPYRTDRFLL